MCAFVPDMPISAAKSSDERTRSAVVEEGIRVKNRITEFCANFKNRQIRGTTEATLSRCVDGVRSLTTYGIEL